MKKMFWIKVKEILWNLKLYPLMKCPSCGKRLAEFGYSDFGYRYQCDNCNWGSII